MNKRGLFWGILLIGLGAIFLLDIMGVFEPLGVSAWGLILPALLIILGIWLIWSIFARRGHSRVEQLSIPDEGIQRADVTINHGAGRLFIAANPSQLNLLEGTFGGGVYSDTSHTADTLRVKLSVADDVVWNFPGNWLPGNSLDWDLKFKTNVRYSFALNTGASESRVDLSDLLVDRITLKTGASSTELSLPQAAGQTVVKAQSGAASLSIKIHENVAARIRATGGLMDIKLDRSRFLKNGPYYQSADYDTAQNKIDLDIETGVGSVKIW